MVNDRQNSVKGRANVDRNDDLPATTPHSHTSHTHGHIVYTYHTCITPPATIFGKAFQLVSNQIARGDHEH